MLTRLVNAVRDAAADRMHARLAAAVEEFDPMLPGRLRASLRVPDGSRFSELELWRRAPTRVSGPGLVKALDRAADLAGLRVREVDCSAVPANRMTAKTARRPGPGDGPGPAGGHGRSGGSALGGCWVT